MLTIQESPFNDLQKKQMREWIEHPGFGLYRRFLKSQAAIKQVEAAAELVLAQDKEDGNAITARIKAEEARVIIAAEKLLEQIQPKEYRFSTVTINPEP